MTRTEADKDWFEWHNAYDDPDSALAIRLEIVRRRLKGALEESPPGEIRLISLCAGQGRDVISVVSGHRRRDDVHARLVELDERNVVVARRSAAVAGLSAAQLEVVQADAGKSDAYLGMAPAGIVLACGIFGNIPPEAIERFVGLVPMLCASGATVIWTRHRRPPNLTGAVRGWFEEGGFEEVAFDEPETVTFTGVGTNRWPGRAGVLSPGVQLFEF